MNPAPGCPVALVGVGNMGGAMLARLRSLGHDVAACDIDPARQHEAAGLGARVLASPAETAACLSADGLLIVCVVDAGQIEDVLFGPQGAAAAMSADQDVMLCPTIAPEDVERLAARLATAGIACIDAPMSGGPSRAREGRMSLMLAAPAQVLARRRHLLAQLSGLCFELSEHPGDGARTKLVNNLLAGINLVGAAEALALAERLGLDVGRTLDVIEQSSGQSWIGSDRMRRAIGGDLAPRAHVTLLEKDTRLAVEAAGRTGFQGPLGERAAQVFVQMHAAGMAELDDGAVLQFVRRQQMARG